VKTLWDILTWLVPFLTPYPTWVKAVVLGGATVIVLIVLGIMAVLLLAQPRPAEQAAGQLVRNGSFEQGPAHWGSGYVEDLARNGNFSEQRQMPYVTTRAESFGRLDTSEHHSGIASFMIHHTSPKADQSWGTLSQRITGLSRNTFYVVRFWAKVRSSERKAVFLVTNVKWERPYYIPPVESDWQQHQYAFNTGEVDTIDLRFVAQAPALLWIDDVTMEEQRVGPR